MGTSRRRLSQELPSGVARRPHTPKSAVWERLARVPGRLVRLLKANLLLLEHRLKYDADLCKPVLQVRGATRPTHYADGVGVGLSTSRRALARPADTQQLVSGNVSKHCL